MIVLFSFSQVGAISAYLLMGKDLTGRDKLMMQVRAETIVEVL